VTDGRFGVSTGAYYPDVSGLRPRVDRARQEEWPFVELLAEDAAQVADVRSLVADGTCGAFARVSAHAPIDPVDLSQLPRGLPTILHPDRYPDAGPLAEDAVFENMDVAKAFGRTAADLAAVFERNPDAGFCLDVAHVWTNDPTLALGHELLDAFGDRLRQVHVSGIEADGRHRPTTADDLALYEPLLDRCGGVPWILETLLA